VWGSSSDFPCLIQVFEVYTAPYIRLLVPVDRGSHGFVLVRRCIRRGVDARGGKTPVTCCQCEMVRSGEMVLCSVLPTSKTQYLLVTPPVCCVWYIRTNFYPLF